MKNILIIAGVFIVGGIGWWLISPLFIDRNVSEKIENIGTKDKDLEIVGQGDFVGLAGHSAQGIATLLKKENEYYVRFEDGFEITNGPDVFVYLGKDGEYRPEARLGVLKGNMGSQNYLVPPGIDVQQYNEVWVWCRAFSVPFGRAEFRSIH